MCWFFFCFVFTARRCKYRPRRSFHRNFGGFSFFGGRFEFSSIVVAVNDERDGRERLLICQHIPGCRGVPILVNSNHLKYIFVFVLRIIHLERNHRHDNVGGKTTKKITQMPFFFVWFSKRSLGMGVRIKSYLGAVISTWYTRAL